MANLGKMYETSYWGSDKGPIRRNLDLPGEKPILLQENIQQMFLQNDIKSSDVKEYDWINVYSTSYIPQEFVAYESGAENFKNLPMFGKILNIFVVHDSEVYFFCQDYDTLYLEESLNSYRISELSTCRLIKCEDLCDRKPLNVWKDYTGSDNKYICLHHMLL